MPESTDNSPIIDTTAQFKRQLPRNSFFQVLSFGTQVIVGILLVPYLTRHLGMAAYGLIPLAGMLTEYVGLISFSISSAVTRFLTIALQRNDFDEANRIFSTAFFSYLVIGFIQVPVFVVLISQAAVIISIPRALNQDATILFSCSAAAFLVNLGTSVFAVPLYSYNRLDIARGIDIGRLLCRLSAIMLLFLTFGPALRYVGYVDLALSIAIGVIQIIFAHRLAPGLQLSLRHYDWQRVKPLTGMGGWLLVNQVGVLLFLRMDVWVCNRFIGPEAAGNYAAVIQWPTLIRAGGAIISGVVAPMMTICYARSETEQLIHLSNASLRVLSLCITVPIGIMCVLSPELLSLWLGQSSADLAPLMVIMLFHLPITVGIMPLFNVQVATNKVRLPALVSLLMGAFNLATGICLVEYLHFGIYGVAIAGVVGLTVKNAFFTPIYAAFILGEQWFTFIRPYLSALALLGGIALFGSSLTLVLGRESLISLVIISSAMAVAGLTAIWYILPNSDKASILSLLSAGWRHST